MRWTRYLTASAVASLVAAVVIAIPTAVLPNPWFSRMTPTTTLDIVLLPVISVSIGALLGTYAVGDFRRTGAPAGSGVLGVLAVGCPVCNKLVVFALGASGALTYFRPLQPLLGAIAVAISAYATYVRLRSLSLGCAVRPADRRPAAAE
jgi:hypothetical protein